MADAPSVTIRPARDDDVRLLFEWRNDPVTRAGSFSDGEVPWEDHVAWFKASLDNPSRHIFMALEEERPVGGKLVRGAGNAARMVAKEGNWVTVLLPSGEMRMVRKE